jgi:glucosamine 6-phosphate synthetase-like amidotransferase/phosphosugar isomerase protein
LLEESQKRGRMASGLAVLTDKKVSLFKTNLIASKFTQTSKYNTIIEGINNKNSFKAMIGHTRYKTKGSEEFNINNHPIKAGRIIGVHNGMINNDDFLFDKYKTDIHRKGQVDSEIIFRLIDLYNENGDTIVESVKKTCVDIFGSCTCAFIDTKKPSYLTIFSNNEYVNAHIFVYEPVKLMVFASEKDILLKALKNASILDPTFVTHEIGVKGNGFRINIHTGKMLEFEVDKNSWGCNYA